LEGRFIPRLFEQLDRLSCVTGEYD
jgi:hypothetical protein